MSTIIDTPGFLATLFRRFALTPHDTVAEARSVYSGAESRLDFAGEWWSIEAETSWLSREEAGALMGWCDRLRDKDAVARLVPPAWQFGRIGTTAAATVSVTATAAAGQRAVAVSGLGAGATLLAGSLVSTAADRLHRLRQSVTADGAGAATLDLFPRLRDALPPGAVLRCGGATPARGLFRMQARPAHAYSSGGPHGYAERVSLQFVEAL